MITVAAAVLLLMQASQGDAAPGADGPVRSSTSFGQVVVHRSDIEVAVSEGLAAEDAARRILKLAVPSFTILEAGYADTRWSTSLTGPQPVYRWAFRNGPGYRNPRPPDYVLRHEIGHGLFIRYLIPSTKPGQYGGDAPDWLDEMAAIAFEADEQTANRRRAAAALARTGELIPLPRLLTMEHPELAGHSGPAASEESVRVVQPSSGDTLPYYATIRAFYDYLLNRTRTSAIVADLASAFRRGKQLDRWILARTGRAGGGEGLEGLNADFLAWVGSDGRFGGRPQVRPE